MCIDLLAYMVYNDIKNGGETMGKRGRPRIGEQVYTALSDEDRLMLEAIAEQHQSSVASALRYILKDWKRLHLTVNQVAALEAEPSAQAQQ
jgi:hypothetical protein